MLWHIVKREIYDQITNLRFGLSLILIMVLFVANALLFVNGYEKRLFDYSRAISEARNRMKRECRQLNLLAEWGPGYIHKEPTPLAFCATGGEDDLPTGVSTWEMYPQELGEMKGAFILAYSYKKYRPNSLLTGLVSLDWAFIFSVIGSLVAILFTYDAICGERQNGTLRLIMSNSISRGTVLLGKFIGTAISLTIIFLIGMLLSLTVIITSGSVPLAFSCWGHLFMMMFISIVYIMLFISLGLLISSCFANPPSSLLTLLACWAVLAVLIPYTGGPLTTILKTAPKRQVSIEQQHAALQQVRERYHVWELRERTAREPNSETILRIWADLLRDYGSEIEKSNLSFLNQRLAQVEFARHLTRISPAAMYTYAMEALANTGVAHYRQFLTQVREYLSSLLDFIRSEDKKDKNSSHIYFVTGGISKAPVDVSVVPQFRERVTVTGALRGALLDIPLLVGLTATLFIIAHIVFLRCEV